MFQIIFQIHFRLRSRRNNILSFFSQNHSIGQNSCFTVTNIYVVNAVCVSLTVVVDVLVVEMRVGRVDAVQRERETSPGRAHGLHGDFVHAQVHDGGQRKALFGLRHPDHLFHPAREKRTVMKSRVSKGRGEENTRPSGGCRRGRAWIRGKSSADCTFWPKRPLARRDLSTGGEGGAAVKASETRTTERKNATGPGADQGRHCSSVRPPAAKSSP